MSLERFIAEENMFADVYDELQIDINAIDQKVADTMFQRLDSNLSPEFLFADGERPRAKAMALKKKYDKAIAELVKKGFRPTVEVYNFKV